MLNFSNFVYMTGVNFLTLITKIYKQSLEILCEIFLGQNVDGKRRDGFILFGITDVIQNWYHILNLLGETDQKLCTQIYIPV